MYLVHTVFIIKSGTGINDHHQASLTSWLILISSSLSIYRHDDLQENSFLCSKEEMMKMKFIKYFFDEGRVWQGYDEEKEF